jgi:hypothetical protein
MLRERLGLLAGILTLLAVALWMDPPAVQAQDVAPPDQEDANCLSCHENLYYLYDTGKWHCLCAASPGCLHCHGGQPATLDEDLAHAGMLANPLQENAAVCRACHCEDCDQHVAQFLSVAGGTVIEGPGKVYPTPGPEPTLPPGSLSGYRLPERLQEPGRLARLGLIGAGLVVLGIYCFRCYRVERPNQLAP